VPLRAGRPTDRHWHCQRRAPLKHAVICCSRVLRVSKRTSPDALAGFFSRRTTRAQPAVRKPAAGGLHAARLRPRAGAGAGDGPADRSGLCEAGAARLTTWVIDCGCDKGSPVEPADP
jgi:hypothetical protein